MKTIILSAALSLLTCASQAQNFPPASADAEPARKAKPAAWLGIAMDVADGKLVVGNVAPDSPAAKAGLQSGDVLVRIGETLVDGKMERVIKSVTGKQPGDAIELQWQRGEKEGTTRIELAARPEPSEKDFRGEFRRTEEVEEAEARAKKLKDKAEEALRKTADAAKGALEETRENLEKLQQRKHALGERKKAEELAEKAAEKKEHPAAFLGIAVEPGEDGNLTVSSVVPDSPAAKAGLKDGDVLLSVGGEPIKGDAQHFVKTIGGKKPGEVIDLRWQRGDKEETSRIELAQRTLESPTQNAVEEFRRKVESSKDEFEQNAKKLRLDLDSADNDKTLRLYFDKEWSGDDKNFKLHFGKEHPLLERKFPGGANNLRGGFFKVDPKELQQSEDAIWKRVQESVAGALKESNLGPDISEKVMQVVESARRASSEKQERRAKLEAEAARLDKEMQALKDRADKLRDELKKSAE